MRKGLEVALIALMSQILLSDASRASHPCKGLLERAQEEVDKDIFQLTIKGATSPKFSRKKVTPL